MRLQFYINSIYKSVTKKIEKIDNIIQNFALKRAIFCVNSGLTWQQINIIPINIGDSKKTSKYPCDVCIL